MRVSHTARDTMLRILCCRAIVNGDRVLRPEPKEHHGIHTDKEQEYPLHPSLRPVCKVLIPMANSAPGMKLSHVKVLIQLNLRAEAALGRLSPGHQAKPESQHHVLGP